MKIIFALFYLLLATSQTAYASCESSNKTVKSDDFEIRYIDMQPAVDSKGLVLIVPPTGGTNYIDRSYGRSLCKSGLHLIILDGWTGDKEFSQELSIHTRFYQRAQRAIELVLKQYDEKSVGILGTSVGALHAAIAMTKLDKINSAFFIVGGGDIAGIIANSDQKVLADAKVSRFKSLNLKSDQEYYEALKKVVPFEPLELPFNRKDKKLGMIISSADKTVPSVNQFLLRDQWHPDVFKTSSWSHTPTIVKTWLFDTQLIVNFFNDKK